MPYPQSFFDMAQNLITELQDNPRLHENKFYMLWSSILHYHFSLEEFGVAPQTSATGTGTKPEILIVKIGRGSQDIVAVIELKKAFQATDAGRDNVETELVDYIEERFSQTRYTTIYGIGGVGLEWTAFKMDKAGSDRPTAIVPWRGDVTSNRSCRLFEVLADEIRAMTSQV